MPERVVYNAERFPFPYLVAKRDHKFYKLYLTQEPEGNEILEKLVQGYFTDLKNKFEDACVKNWKDNQSQPYILYKGDMEAENYFYQNMESYKKCDKEKFLQKRYPLRFFSLKLLLNDNKSIHLHQHVVVGVPARLVGADARAA